MEQSRHDLENEQAAGNQASATKTSYCADGLPASFKVRRGAFKKEEWVVDLTSDSATFTHPSNNEVIVVPRDEANARIEFAQAFTFMPSRNIRVRQGSHMHQFALDGSGRTELCSWLPKKTGSELKNELRKWGVGLIILGGVHLVLTEFLDPVWGLLIAGIGVLNLAIPRRGMFIVNGTAVLLAGLMNISAEAGWKMFGMLQLIWGVQEMRKYSRYLPRGANCGKEASSVGARGDRRQISRVDAKNPGIAYPN